MSSKAAYRSRIACLLLLFSTAHTVRAQSGQSSGASAIGAVNTQIEVTSPLITLNPTEGFDRTVSKETIETSPGTFGDPSRFMQLLPGVVSDNDQYNDFLVRGGVPSENLFIVDNIEVPSINHLALSDTTGGFVSMIDNAAVQRLTLHTDAYDTKYEQRLSSIVDITTLPDRVPAARMQAEVGIAGVGLSVTRPLADKRGSWFISGRRSVLNLFTDDIGLNGVPIYTNGFIRADKHTSSRDTWWGLSLTGVDSIKIHPDAFDAWETSPYDTVYDGWRNTTGVNWQHIFSPKVFGVWSLSNSVQTQSIVTTAQLLNDSTVYTENTRDNTSIMKYDLAFQITPKISISAGGRAAVDFLNYRVNQPQGLQNPYTEDPAPMNATAFNREFAAGSSAGYIQATAILPVGARLTLGARLAQWAITGDHAASPKLLLAVPVHGHNAHVGYAEYAQLPPNLYLLAFNNQKSLSVIRSQQITAGADLLQGRSYELSIEGYQKKYLDYPVAEEYPQLSLGNIADTFGQAFLMFPMRGTGKGVARGVELSSRWRLGSRLNLVVSGTYSRVWYAGTDNILRKGNYDLPLVGNVFGTCRVRNNGILSFRYSGYTGRPYTPDNYALSVEQQRDVYDLNQINAARGPAYNRLDFRYQQSHELRRGTLTWHVGLQNALGADNFYDYAWRPRAGGAGVLAQSQMPRFPDGGVKFTF